jgi:hypothetical protein
MSMQITCRKCGGSHLTIKCGKEPNHKKNLIEDKPIKNKHISKYNKQIYRIKISDLPNDISEKEMMELMYNWGDITKIKVLNYPENSVVYIDFKYEIQADYFIKALHKTIFEYSIINVVKVETDDYKK